MKDHIPFFLSSSSILMATDSSTSLHSTTPEKEPIETKVIQEVKTMEQETISLSKEVKEEENLKIEELPSGAKEVSKSEGEPEHKLTRPPAVDDSAADVPVKEKLEVPKDPVPHSHEQSGPEPVVEAANGESVPQPTIESVAGVHESVKETQPEQHKTVDAPESSAESVEIPKELSDTVPPKESEEVMVKDLEVLETVSKEVDKAESQLAEVDVKLKEQSGVIEQVEKSESVEEIGKLQEKPLEVAPVKETESEPEPVVKDVEVSVAASQKVDQPETVVPEVEVQPKQESEATGKVEIESVVSEVERKPKEGSESTVEVEPESVIPEAEAKPKEEYEATLKVEPVSVVPEVEAKPKEASEATRKVEPVSVVPEVEATPKEESEVTVQVDSVSAVSEVEEKPKEQSQAIEKVEPESVVPEVEEKPKEQSQATKQVEPTSVVPEVGSKPKELSEATEKVEKVESVEAIENIHESSEVLPVKEPEAAIVKDAEGSAELKDADKQEPAAPVVDAKSEEQSVSAEAVEKPTLLEVKQDESSVTEETEPKLLDHEVEVKPKEESKVAEEVELESTGEKTVLIKPDVEVKPEGETEVAEKVEAKEGFNTETSVDERSLADKVEDTTSVKEEKTGREEEPNAASQPDVTEKAAPEDGKKESDGTDATEVPSKKVEVGTEKGGKKKQETAIETAQENVNRDVPNEEPAQPINVKDVKDVVSGAEVSDRSFTGGEPVAENKEGENIKEETPPATVETSKDVSVEGNVDEPTTTVTEAVQEFQDSGSAVKEEGSAKRGDDKLEKENVEEKAKSDVQDLEPSTKDGDDATTSRDLPTEVAGKSAQKQSSNILTKVKQSLVKAKKAIIGKSPNTKTIVSDAKGDIKVK